MTQTLKLMKRMKVEADNDGNFTQVDQQHDLSQDRLSFLPDSLLVSILSLLPIEQAAATSILSHNWRHLWTQISHLKLHSFQLPRHKSRDADAQDCLPSFLAAVDRIFQQLTSTKMYSFDIFIFANHYRQNCDLEPFIRSVIALRVEEIRVNFSSYPEYRCQLPGCIFQCPSLVVLNLDGNLRIEMVNDNVNINLPNLKKFRFRIPSDFDCETVANLLKSCPALEDLELITSWKEDDESIFLHVSCPNLRSLRIWTLDISAPYLDCKIDAPRLEIFHFSGSVSFDFIQIPSSLVEVDLRLYRYGDDADTLEEMQQVLQGICSTKSLSFMDTKLYPGLSFDGLVPPCFRNMTRLQISLYHSIVCNTVLWFLRCTPNLEALVIEANYRDEIEFGWNESDSVPACFPHKLKDIKVKLNEGTCKALNFLKYILQNANALLKLDVIALSKWNTFSDAAAFCKQLFRCPRSCTCVIHFSCEVLCASSKKRF